VFGEDWGVDTPLCVIVRDEDDEAFEATTIGGDGFRWNLTLQAYICQTKTVPIFLSRRPFPFSARTDFDKTTYDGTTLMLEAPFSTLIDRTGLWSQPSELLRTVKIVAATLCAIDKFEILGEESYTRWICDLKRFACKLTDSFPFGSQMKEEFRKFMARFGLEMDYFFDRIVPRLVADRLLFYQHHNLHCLETHEERLALNLLCNSRFL
jgi:hypothetical protein